MRKATKADIPSLTRMIKRFAAESSYAGHISVSDEHTVALLDLMLSSEDKLVLVHERNDAIIGMLGAFVFEHPFSGERVCSELFWWMEPEVRGPLAGVKLMRAMEQWARERGAVRAQMIAPIDRVGKFYEAVGYNKIETMYQRALT